MAHRACPVTATWLGRRLAWARERRRRDDQQHAGHQPGRVWQRAVHRVQRPVVLRCRHRRLRRRHRGCPACGRRRRRCGSGGGGPQPATTGSRRGGVARRRPMGLDALFVPVGGGDRPGHRAAGAGRSRRRSRRLDRARDRGGPARRHSGYRGWYEIAHRRTCFRYRTGVGPAARGGPGRCHRPACAHQRDHRPAKTTCHPRLRAGAHRGQRGDRRCLRQTIRPS